MQSDSIPVLLSMGFALLLTILIEEVVAIFFFGKKWIGYILVLLVNVVTNPIINLFYQWLNTYRDITPYSPMMILLELIVVPVEYMLLAQGLNSKRMRWLVLSFLMNTVSYIAGLVLLPIMGSP